MVLSAFCCRFIYLILTSLVVFVSKSLRLWLLGEDWQSLILMFVKLGLESVMTLDLMRWLDFTERKVRMIMCSAWIKFLSPFNFLIYKVDVSVSLLNVCLFLTLTSQLPLQSSVCILYVLSCQNLFRNTVYILGGYYVMAKASCFHPTSLEPLHNAVTYFPLHVSYSAMR